MATHHEQVQCSCLAQAPPPTFAVIVMQALPRVDTDSEPELGQPKRFSFSWPDRQGLVGVAYCRRKTLAVGAVLLAVVGVASLRFNNQCINLGAPQGKSEAGTQGQRVAV